MRIKNNSGHTLTETMMSLGIFVVLIAGIYTTMYAGNISWAMQDTSSDVQAQARRVIGKMTRDLRVGQSIVVVQDSNNVTVTFSRSGGNVTYAWTTNAGSTQNQLIRTDSNGAIVTAQDISALSVTDSTNDIKINVTVSAQTKMNQTVSYSLVGNAAKR